MRKQTFTSALIVASAALWFTGCAGAGNRTAGEHIDDATLTAKVKTALIGDERTKARQIDVETFKGVVQLNGFVDSAAAKTAAASVARGVSGVGSVKNNLQVGADRTAGRTVDDTGITAKVRAALIDDPRTKSHQIEVTTNGGVVQLGGFVDTAASKAAAEQLAGRVAGVTRVTNRLQVRPN
ncbi:MAG: BON domain-containing protein [Gammaproteobacteria bacterium]